MLSFPKFSLVLWPFMIFMVIVCFIRCRTPCQVRRIRPLVSSKAILSALLNAEKLDVGPNLTSFKEKSTAVGPPDLMRFFFECALFLDFEDVPFCSIISIFSCAASNWDHFRHLVQDMCRVYHVCSDPVPSRRSSQLALTRKWRAWPLATASPFARHRYYRLRLLRLSQISSGNIQIATDFSRFPLFSNVSECCWGIHLSESYCVLLRSYLGPT